MMEISTDRIISQRLCLVCAQEGIERPVQEHRVNEGHFAATFTSLTLGGDVFGRTYGESWDATGIDYFADADLLRYAIDVGGFRSQEVYVPDLSCLTYTHGRTKLALQCAARDLVMKWAAGSYLCDTPREAILRAKMEQLWDGLEGESDGR